MQPARVQNQFFKEFQEVIERTIKVKWTKAQDKALDSIKKYLSVVESLPTDGSNTLETTIALTEAGAHYETVHDAILEFESIIAEMKARRNEWKAQYGNSKRHDVLSRGSYDLECSIADSLNVMDNLIDGYTQEATLKLFLLEGLHEKIDVFTGNTYYIAWKNETYRLAAHTMMDRVLSLDQLIQYKKPVS
mmetsp:Transcript_4117/g.6093  ORF Transcript_4117/g.6093 Transcript_4117/m.6093 type:complete len:191 (+) Transcript_4117:33-605(+)